MALADYKITDTDVSTNGVAAAPDKLTGSAAENKAVFDRLIRECVKGNFNALIDYISGLGLETLTGNAVRSGGTDELRWLRIGSNGAIQYSADGTSWQNIFGTAEVEHVHDDRYYTETETDALLAKKAPLTHVHDDRYYTESEIDSLLDGKYEYAPVEEVTASRALALTDKGKLLNCTAAVTLTVPDNDSVALPVGAELEIFRGSGGAVSIAAAEGVAFAIAGGSATTADSQSIAEQYSSVVIKQISADVWSIQGALG